MSPAGTGLDSRAVPDANAGQLACAEFGDDDGEPLGSWVLRVRAEGAEGGSWVEIETRFFGAGAERLALPCATLK